MRQVHILLHSTFTRPTVTTFIIFQQLFEILELFVLPLRLNESIYLVNYIYFAFLSIQPLIIVQYSSILLIVITNSHHFLLVLDRRFLLVLLIQLRKYMFISQVGFDGQWVLWLRILLTHDLRLPEIPFHILILQFLFQIDVITRLIFLLGSVTRINLWTNWMH